MTDELQTDESGITLDTDPIENNEADTGTVENGAELAPATGENQDKNEDGESAQDKANKAINKQHARMREQERRAIAAENKAKEFEDKLAAIEAEKGEVIIPPIPDPYDDDFEEKVKARDEAITRKATQDAQQANVIEQQNAATEAAGQAEQARVQSLVGDYDKRIVKLGLDPVDVRTAGDKVIEYGISSDLVEHIMQQDDGPLITKYLADNPILVDEMRHMTSIQAAIKINSEVKLAAASMKPQASNAPDPAETLSGRGAGEKVSPFIEGATFE